MEITEPKIRDETSFTRSTLEELVTIIKSTRDKEDFISRLRGKAFDLNVEQCPSIKFRVSIIPHYPASWLGIMVVFNSTDGSIMYKLYDELKKLSSTWENPSSYNCRALVSSAEMGPVYKVSLTIYDTGFCKGIIRTEEVINRLVAVERLMREIISSQSVVPAEKIDARFMPTNFIC